MQLLYHYYFIFRDYDKNNLVFRYYFKPISLLEYYRFYLTIMRYCKSIIMELIYLQLLYQIMFNLIYF